MKEQELSEIMKRFNDAIAPLESEFMVYVEKYRDIGFGRMIQMITKKWESELKVFRKKREKEEQDKWR